MKIRTIVSSFLLAAFAVASDADLQVNPNEAVVRREVKEGHLLGGAPAYVLHDEDLEAALLQKRVGDPEESAGPAEPSEWPSESDPEPPLPTESEGEDETTTSTTEPEPTLPVVDPTEPIIIIVVLEGESLEFLTDGVHLKLFEGERAVLKIDEGYLKVGEDKWGAIDEDGLVVLVSNREEAAHGWRIEEGQLFYEPEEVFLARDSEQPIVFSVCENEQEEFLIHVGEAAGCIILEEVLLENLRDDPIEPSASEEPIDEPTPEPTEEPSEEPSEEPTEEPSEEPSEEPIDEPTPEPTDEPTAEPTDEPTDEPTAEPTDEPTEEPSTPVNPTTVQPESTAETPTDVSTTDESTGEPSSGTLSTATTTTVTDLVTTTTFVSEDVSVVTTTSCDETGSYTEIVTTLLPESEKEEETTWVTVTEDITITVTNCDDTTLCQTSTEVRSTVYTTYCPVTTAADATTEGFKSTVVITVCSEETICEEVVTVIPASETVEQQTTGGEPAVAPVTTGVENRATFLQSSPIIAGLFVFLPFFL
ncbi:hypothetical protein Cantr_05075 [Candida viswanathii]|uniref:Uncharacterized protein n=1 Tax=Candida viswanathii TaxID=5486 RepID=A0A367XRW4_9ASCO|nr:hypothetical protein Cantr_05075 [Candida viswanathii]